MRTKPAIHGRDHAPGGADPIPSNASFYPAPCPGGPALAVHPSDSGATIYETGIARFPGGVISTRATLWRNSAGGILDTAVLSPTDPTYLGGRSVRSDQNNATVTSASPCVSFRPVDDLGCDVDRKYVIFIGFRAHPSATNPRFVVHCAGQWGGIGNVLWPRGNVNTNVGVGTNFGWASMGFGTLSGFETKFKPGDVVDVLAACSGGTTKIWIDWIMLMPFGGDCKVGSLLDGDTNYTVLSYYYQAGQGPPSPPPGTDGTATDGTANQNETVIYSSQQRDSPCDPNMTLLDGGNGQVSSVINDENTIYAAYTFARTHNAGTDYTASRFPYDSARITWWENEMPIVTARVPADGAWRPYYLGMYQAGFSELGISAWTTTNKFAYFENQGGPCDEVRVQSYFFVPVRQGLDLLPF